MEKKIPTFKSHDEKQKMFYLKIILFLFFINTEALIIRNANRTHNSICSSNFLLFV